jgi:hypothetical protein
VRRPASRAAQRSTRRRGGRKRTPAEKGCAGAVFAGACSCPAPRTPSRINMGSRFARNREAESTERVFIPITKGTPSCRAERARNTRSTFPRRTVEISIHGQVFGIMLWELHPHHLNHGAELKMTSGALNLSPKGLSPATAIPFHGFSARYQVSYSFEDAGAPLDDLTTPVRHELPGREALQVWAVPISRGTVGRCNGPLRGRRASLRSVP